MPHAEDWVTRGGTEYPNYLDTEEGADGDAADDDDDDDEEEEEYEAEEWDQPKIAVQFLQGLCASHEAQLKTLPIRSDGAKAAFPNLENLFDLVDRGAKKPLEATPIAIFLREELRYVELYIELNGRLSCLF